MIPITITAVEHFNIVGQMTEIGRKQRRRKHSSSHELSDFMQNYGFSS